MKKLFLPVAAVLVILICGVYFVQKKIERPGPLATEAYVVIPKGTSSRTVAFMLDEAGIIDNPLLLRLAMRLNGTDKRMKAGEYRFEPGISLRGVIHKMVQGDVFFRRLTLPEGLTTRQMLEIINGEPMLSGEITETAAEGDLLPETYSFSRGEQRNDIVRRAKAAMNRVKQEAWGKKDGDVPLKTPQEMIILASIIEKETGVPEERGLVASVFVNRLKKGMKLQTDPTVIYALTKGEKELGRALLKKDLDVDSPFNTYKYYGLPPAPICNPGRASIEAAVNPEISDYLYFVASGDGGHNFAKSLYEHNSNVAQWRKARKRQ